MTMASGAVISLSTKQKVNTHSSTEARLVAVDDVMAKILWTKKFIEWQGSEVKLNILYQDNTSMMKLEMNGKSSCGKRTTHFDIKIFYVTNLVERKEVTIEYVPLMKWWQISSRNHWLVTSLEKTRDRSWIIHPSSETAGVWWSTKRFRGIEVQVCQHREGYESAEIFYAEEE